MVFKYNIIILLYFSIYIFQFKYNNERQRRNTSSSSVILFTEKISLKYCPVLGLGDKRQPGRFGQKLRCKMQRKVRAGHSLRRSKVHFFIEEQIVMGGLGALAPGKA